MRRHQVLFDLQLYRVPQPPAPTMVPAAFAMCPLSMMPGASAAQWLAVQQIYRAAFEQAQAVARPSILERDLLAMWN